ncbi:MAG: ferritin [Caldisericum sp.]
MINSRLQDAINEQINREFFSAYLYLSMGQYFESKFLRGIAHWFYVQYKEELKHAEKFISFLNEKGGRVILKEIPAPKIEWNGALDVFNEAYNHEKFITSSIENIMKIAVEENDFSTQNLLNWFLDEQVEEEAQTLEIVKKIELVGEHGQALYMLDRELAQREG